MEEYVVLELIVDSDYSVLLGITAYYYVLLCITMYYYILLYTLLYMTIISISVPPRNKIFGICRP